MLHSADEIAKKVGQPAVATPQQPVPMQGKGTVLIASEYRDSGLQYLANTYLHETANILAYQMYTDLPYNERPYSRQAKSETIRHIDRDVGAAFDECLRGGIDIGGYIWR
jgi:hypothetical protein